MALLKRLKNLIDSTKNQSAETPTAVPVGAAADGGRRSFEGKPGMSLEEKRERITRLTLREHELFLLLLEGYTLRESAEKLTVKYSTANTHMSGMYKKLGVKTRAELIINYRFAAGAEADIP